MRYGTLSCPSYAVLNGKIGEQINAVLDGCRRVLTTEPVHGSTVHLSCCAASAHLFQNLWSRWCQYEIPLRRSEAV